MNINGLTQKDFRTHEELLIKANNEQLEALDQLLFNERLKRTSIQARQDIGLELESDGFNNVKPLTNNDRGGIEK